jgi:hypothetical protein
MRAGCLAGETFYGRGLRHGARPDQNLCAGAPFDWRVVAGPGLLRPGGLDTAAFTDVGSAIV